MTVQCPACHFENPDGFAFCGKCGAKLVVVCPQCGAEIPPGFAFCGRCGTRLTPPEPAGAITESELARIEPYLLPDIFNALPPAALWQSADVAHIQERLAHLLESVVTYLPRYLVQTELAAPDAAAGGEFLHGTLLFSDISGFTAMSERLSTLGKEGAEQIVALVNRYFSAMLDVLFTYGGDLFKFGGDALLAYFPDGPKTPGSVNALHAAWAMQQAMAEFRQVETSLGTFPLRMKIGMHAGPFFAARVGTPTEREFVVTGATVNATAMAESAAVAGQILVSSAVHAQVRTQPGFTFTPGPPGYYLLGALTHTHIPMLSPSSLLSSSATPTFHQTVTALGRLTPYLPPGLLARLLPANGVQDAHTAEYDSGEHRLVAILFANFTGASDLVDNLGPSHEDEIANALNDYFITMDEVVERYGGVVNKIDLYDHGDKLMALFGAPVAHEDDAERAVRTALDMQRALEETVPWAQQRIGVSTGMVFAGHVGGATRREYTVMGDEVNLAARLMSAAQDGEVLLASYVQRKVRPFFEVADRGEVRLKGKSKPVPTFTIVGRRAQPEPVRGIRGLRSTLVGRDVEQATLRRLLAELFTGRGGILSLIGEAGLGKSRMVAEMHANVCTQTRPDEIALTWVEGRCLSYTQHVSYSAFTDVIHASLGILDTDNEFDIREKLRRYIAYLFPSAGVDDVRPYLAHFLNLPLSEPEAERVTYLSGEALQRQMLRAIAALIERIAIEQPLVIVFEDLHWADSSSLLLLERCFALTDRVPLLIVMLYRPVRDHGCYDLGLLAARDYPHRYVEVALKPLDLRAGQDRELVCNLLALEELPPPLAHLVSRAEGNPFYIEEIIRSLIDQGIIVPKDGGWRLDREIDLRAVPDSLQGLIMARIDQLIEEARRTLQLAAIVGRTFTHELLAWLSAAALMAQALITHLDSNLAALQRTELIRERTRLPELEYIFKHVMVRDVAYESLLLRDRRIYHGLIGQHLEEIYIGQKREEIYELLAHHYSLSEDHEKALDYLIKSGDKARAAYANLEAIAFYRRAETLANELEEVEAQAFIAEGLGDVLFYVGESTEALVCYERALGCCGDVKRQADLYQRIAIVYEMRGDYEQAFAKCSQGMAMLPADEQTAVEMARLRIARSRIYEQQGQSDAALTEGEKSLVILEGTTHYLEIAQAHKVLGLGFRYNQPSKAIQHLEQALAILERIGDEYEAARIYNNLAILYYQTDLARSTAYFTQVLKTMQRLGNVWQEAVAYLNLGGVHFVQGNHEQAIDYYKRSLVMQERLGNNLGIANCHINLGEVYRAEGDLDQAIKNLERGLNIAREIRASDAEAECLRQLAECYVEIGAPERALTACEKALSYAETMGNRQEEAAIYRVLGKAHTEMQNLPGAWSSLEQSIAILRELEQEFDLGTALFDYAHVLKEADKLDLARTALTEALTLFERLQLPQEQERVHAALDQIAQL
ncbi:MAG: tetratricopeptide repeat protein [Anaerolineae bacterium]|nr:tetratricopeptide repeat protein [Anaerolineae bacterium]